MAALIQQIARISIATLAVKVAGAKARIPKVFTTETWFENLTTLTSSTLLRVILREIEG
jgi:hypothetical protein